MKATRNPILAALWPFALSSSAPRALAADPVQLPRCPAKDDGERTTIISRSPDSIKADLHWTFDKSTYDSDLYCANVYVERAARTFQSRLSTLPWTACHSHYSYKNKSDNTTTTSGGWECLIYYVGRDAACLASCEEDYDCYVASGGDESEGAGLEFGSCEEAATAYADTLPGVETFGGWSVSKLSLANDTEGYSYYNLFRPYRGPDADDDEKVTTLLFLASDCDDGTVDVIKYDDTAGEVTTLLSKMPGDCTTPDRTIPYNDKVYFTIPQALGEGDFWVTEGTPETTKIFLKRNSTEDELDEFLVFRDMMYFVEGGRRLWRSDGTEEGTVVVEEFEEGGLVDIASAGNEMLLLRFPSNNEVRTSDGYSSSAVLTTEADNPRIGAGNNVPFVQGKALFRSECYSDSGDACVPGLWSTGGTPETTTKISDVDVRSFAPDAIDGRILFNARMGFVFSTDGTAEETIPLKFTKDVDGIISSMPLSDWPTYVSSTYDVLSQFNGVIRFMPSFNNKFTFQVNGFGIDVSNSTDIWTTDGTESGTELVTRLYLFESYQGTRIGGGRLLLYNSADGEVWITDGTAARTKLLMRSASPDIGYDWIHLAALGDGFVLINSSRGAVWRFEMEEEKTAITSSPTKSPVMDSPMKEAVPSNSDANATGNGEVLNVIPSGLQVNNDTDSSGDPPPSSPVSVPETLDIDPGSPTDELTFDNSGTTILPIYVAIYSVVVVGTFWSWQ